MKRNGMWRNAAMARSTVRCLYLSNRQMGQSKAHFDKGILHVNVKKPAEATKNAKTTEIKAGHLRRQRGKDGFLSPITSGWHV